MLFGEKEKTKPRYAPEYEPNADLESQRETIECFRRHIEEIRADDDLRYAVSTYLLLSGLDENLNYRQDEKVAIFGKELIGVYQEINNIRANPLGDFVLRKLTDMMLAFYKQNDPRYSWNNEMRKQSTLSPEGRRAGLTGQGGFWAVEMEMLEKSESHGAREMQMSVVQLLLEIANLQENFADTTLPYVSEPPDAGYRTKYVTDAKELKFRAKHEALDWQRGEGVRNEYLRGIKEPKYLDMKYSPLYQFIKGGVRYCEYESLESLPLRVYREVAGKAQYLDMPANEFLMMSEKQCEQLSGFSMTKDIERGWKEVPEEFDADEVSPVIAVSIGGYVSPESRLFKMARSGMHLIHLHFNHLNNTQQIGFGHGSIDGMDGIGLSLAVAEVVGATADTLTGLAIEWSPPTQEGVVEVDGLKKMMKMIYGSKTNEKYVDDPGILSFVNGFELSDIAVSEEFEVGEYRLMEELVLKINERWFESTRKKLEAIIGNELSGKARGDFLFRLANSKMTVTKYLDFMTRQYDGPSAVCFVPRVREQRLDLLQMMTAEDGVREMVATYPMRDEGGVFGLTKEKLSRMMKKAYDLMRKEYSRAWATVSEVSAIKETVSQFRTATEVASFLLNKPMFEAIQMEIQNSFGGSAELTRRLGKKEDSKKSPKIRGFKSAHTAGLLEDRFGNGRSFLSKMREGGETLRINDRVRLTTRKMDRLNMSNPQRMGSVINEVAETLSRGDEREFARIKDLALRALRLCFQARQEIADTEVPDYHISNIYVVMSALDKEPTEEVFAGLQYLTIAGIVDYNRGFRKVAVDGAKEVLESL